MNQSHSNGTEASGDVRVLALDPGIHMGWATLHDSGGVCSGVQHFEGCLDSRLGEFMRWLEGNLPSFAVVMERPQGLQGMAVESQIGMIGVARAIANNNEILFVPISPMTAKKAATGRGHAKKHEVVAWAKKAYGNIEDDNEADALALLECWKRIE